MAKGESVSRESLRIDLMRFRGGAASRGRRGIFAGVELVLD